MKKQIKQMFLSVVLLSTISMGSLAMLSETAFADPQTNVVTTPAPQAQNTMGHHFKHHRPCANSLSSGAWVGVPGNKHLTTDDARVIAQAALILHGEKQLKVGDISTRTTKKGFNLYAISIVNSQGKVVRSVLMNSRNGQVRLMPKV